MSFSVISTTLQPYAWRQLVAVTVLDLLFIVRQIHTTTIGSTDWPKSRLCYERLHFIVIRWFEFFLFLLLFLSIFVSVSVSLFCYCYLFRNCIWKTPAKIFAIVFTNSIYSEFICWRVNSKVTHRNSSFGAHNRFQLLTLIVELVD